MTRLLLTIALGGMPIQESPSSPARPLVNNHKPIVLYEEGLDSNGLTGLSKCGAEKYFVIYQNNADTNAQKSGLIDPSAVAHSVAKGQGDTPQGWGVLDFEDPFDQLLQTKPSSEATKAAVKSMVETIRVMKRVFPNVKWTYYGMPGLLYYLPDGDWHTATQGSKDAEISRQLSVYGPVLSECDWLAPCVYYTVGDGHQGRTPPQGVRMATQAWVTARTKMCVDFAAKQEKPVPVIPFASPLYMPGGGSRAFSVIASEILDEDIVAPISRAGAAGICMWTGATNFIGIATGERPGDTMTEGGGKVALIKTWSEDLNVSPRDLEGEIGRERLTRMISQAQVSMAASAKRRWSKSTDAPALKPPQ
jgi:hypothetical protein